MSMLASIAVAVALIAQPDQSADPCAVDQEAMLALSPQDFDQSDDRGWRPLGDIAECRAAAAELIRTYRRTNWRSMTTGQVHTSYWHEGQMRAASGDADRAVPLLMAGTNPSSVGGAEYQLGTIAFLRGDLAGLTLARERLAALPVPKDLEEMREAARQGGAEFEWPPNLHVLDRLIACFGKPYSEAYGTCPD